MPKGVRGWDLLPYAGVGAGVGAAAALVPSYGTSLGGAVASDALAGAVANGAVNLANQNIGGKPIDWGEVGSAAFWDSATCVL
jgi:hypothetical protein